MHKLRIWRKDKRMPQSEFAALIGVSTGSVSNYENGRVPRWPVMLKIVEVTKGKVRPGDFYTQKIGAGQ